jgi:hypothetical protein
MPFGNSEVGKEAGRWVLRVEFHGESAERCKSSKVGGSIGIYKLFGAMNIVFSTFPKAVFTHDSRTNEAMLQNLIVSDVEFGMQIAGRNHARLMNFQAC